MSIGNVRRNAFNCFGVSAYTGNSEPDAEHAWVMLQQCNEQVKRFRQLAIREGSDLKLTYLLERLEQILARIRALLGILDADDPSVREADSLALFRQLVAEQSTERSIMGLFRQTSYLLSKSVTNHASETGEHYVTEGRREYMHMVGRGLGADALPGKRRFRRGLVVAAHPSKL